MIRRKFIKGITLSSTSLAFGNVPFPYKGNVANKPLQMVHITDTHVFNDKDCPQFMEIFLEEIKRIAPTPDLIFHSGDVIMDALYKEERSIVKDQWQLWHSMANQMTNKVQYAIGNHDIWGQGPKSDTMYGKKWAMEEMGLDNRFYSFIQENWKFIVLDSTQVFEGKWYTANMDSEQMEWLKGELDGTSMDTNVMIISHIPILSTSIFDWAKSENNNWSVSAGLMHSDTHEIQAVLNQYFQVKLCISGHLHLLDDVRYNGIDYLGSGAACGNWWNSNTFKQTQCGFCVYDLYPDGSYRRWYHTYDWLK